jgi:hypothetical protein
MLPDSQSTAAAAYYSQCMMIIIDQKDLLEIIFPQEKKIFSCGNIISNTKNSNWKTRIIRKVSLHPTVDLN